MKTNSIQSVLLLFVIKNNLVIDIKINKLDEKRQNLLKNPIKMLTLTKTGKKFL